MNGPLEPDHNKQHTITLTMITLSGFPCIVFGLRERMQCCLPNNFFSINI